jgi:hypothetical protein
MSENELHLEALQFLRIATIVSFWFWFHDRCWIRIFKKFYNRHDIFNANVQIQISISILLWKTLCPVADFDRQWLSHAWPAISACWVKDAQAVLLATTRIHLEGIQNQKCEHLLKQLHHTDLVSKIESIIYK